MYELISGIYKAVLVILGIALLGLIF